jgi:voltage-gated potassium channel
MLDTTRILRALRIRRYLLNIEDEVQRCLAEMSLTLIVMILYDAALMQFLEEHIQNYFFNVWIYYMFTTMTTVGYGDVAPKSNLGRFAAMAYITTAITIVPKMTNELVEKMNRSSVYSRASFRSKKTRFNIFPFKD